MHFVQICTVHVECVCVCVCVYSYVFCISNCSSALVVFVTNERWCPIFYNL